MAWLVRAVRRRALTGGHTRDRTEFRGGRPLRRMYSKCPPHMVVKLCRVVPSAALSDVFLGFTRCGTWVLSYSRTSGALTVWRFRGRRPMVREWVFAPFDGRLATAELHLTVSQPTPGELCLVATPPLSSVTKGDTAIVSVEWMALPSNRTDPAARAVGIQFRYALHSPYPMFSPPTCDSLPGITLFNTGSAIEAYCWQGGRLLRSSDSHPPDSPVTVPVYSHFTTPNATLPQCEQLRFDADQFLRHWLQSAEGEHTLKGTHSDEAPESFEWAMQDYDLRLLGTSRRHLSGTAPPSALLLLRLSVSHCGGSHGVAELLVELHLETGHADAVVVTPPAIADRRAIDPAAAAAAAKQWGTKVFGRPVSAEAAPYALSNRALFNEASLPYLRHPRLPWALVP
eukprot:m.468478 g.468478  ORF g.468478 m.468478 type:complete len:399 (-) comp27528_c0_seq1:47-1243(-)